MAPQNNWQNSLLYAVFKDYWKNTTIHGYKYLVLPNRPKIEKCIWFIILTTTFSMMFYMFLLLINDYNSKVTITTLESTKYSILNVPFPAIAICNINRVSKQQLSIMASEMSQDLNMTEGELMILLRKLGKLYDFELDKFSTLHKLQDVVEHYSSDIYTNYDILMNILFNLSPTCNETLVKCKWIGEDIDCNEIFRTRRTMDGYCCTFNYQKTWKDFILSKINAKLINDSGEELQYFQGAGVENGLSVVVYSNPDDYYYPLVSAEGFSVQIFNPYDYPDVSSGSLIESFLPLKHEIFMQLTATTIKPVPTLKSIPLNKRGCVFNNEGKTVFDSTFYSFSDCLTNCKLRSILSLCECVPFFLPVMKSYAFSKQICTVTDIPCLNKFKEKWMTIYPKMFLEELELERENSLYCPQCLPSCSSTTYGIDINQAVLTNLPYQDLKNVDLNKYSIIHIYSDTADTLYFESDMNYYWYDIISNFGGTCSLFLGFSLISIVEFFYFITIKYYRLLKK